MNQPSSEVKSRLPLLIANLFFLAACALGLLIITIGYLIYKQIQPKAPVRPTVTLINTLTLTATELPTLTPTVTFTSRPTSTITPSITPPPSGAAPSSSPTPPVPSLTPAQALGFKGAYRLRDWGPDQADELAHLIQGYPVGMQPEGERSPAYFQAYRFPIFALEEALLRYPSADQVESWRWMLAFNQVLVGDPKSGETYAGLIADNLNRQQVSISELYAWFEIQEPRLKFFMVEAQTPPDVFRSYLIELRADAGSAFIWLRETASAYQAFSLYTQFDFNNPRTSNWIIADLDNDASNGNEIAITFSTLSDETRLPPPKVFNLSKNEPVFLKFIPEASLFDLGITFDNNWRVRQDNKGKNLLSFETTVYPPCPLRVMRAYQWNGVYFKLVESKAKLEELPKSIGVCEPLIDLTAHYWGASEAVGVMETLLPKWPPVLDVKGQPVSPDELDAFRYRLAIFKLLSGDDKQAVELFNQISTTPTIPTSNWAAPSQSFLADYQAPEDLYRACRLSRFCDPSIAIEILTARIPSHTDVLAGLRKWGVEPAASGFFDFEDDDTLERWFTIRNTPQGALDFWVLPTAGGYFHALRIGTVSTRSPSISYIEPAYIADEGLLFQPAVLLDGKISFSLRRYPDTRLAFVVPVPLREEYPSRFFVPLESYREALLAGGPPELIQQKLEDLEDNPGLLCRATWSCDEYGYLLGLAAELANNLDQAVQAYQNLWLNYSKSPFTAMARMKLVAMAELIHPSQTPSLTPTGPSDDVLETVTLTPSPSGTPTTPTPSPTGGTPTITPTSTNGTSYPPIPTIGPQYP